LPQKKGSARRQMLKSGALHGQLTSIKYTSNNAVSNFSCNIEFSLSLKADEKLNIPYLANEKLNREKWNKICRSFHNPVYGKASLLRLQDKTLSNDLCTSIRDYS
jgi:hypothetical protein